MNLPALWIIVISLTTTQRGRTLRTFSGELAQFVTSISSRTVLENLKDVAS